MSIFAYAYLGPFVYLKNPHQPTNRAFFIFSLITVYSCFTDFQMRVAESFAVSHFWFRLGTLWHIQLPVLLYFVFSFTGLSQRKRFNIVYIPLYLIGLTFAALDFFGNLVIDGPRPSPWGWSYGEFQPTIIGNLDSIWCTALILIGIMLCLRHYLKATDSLERQSAKYVLIGTSVPLLAGIFEIVMSRSNITIPDLLLFGIVTGAGFWAYAVWKYELFILSPATSVQQIVQTMSDLLFLISPERKIKVINQAVIDLLGYERDELIDQPIQMLIDEAEYQRIFESAISMEMVKHGHINDAEIHVRSKNGGTITISLAGSIIRDKKSRFRGIAFIGRDITKRKLAEQELRRYQEKLEEMVAKRTAELEATYAQLQRVQKMEFMGAVAGGVAHDLNNILSGIVTYPEVLLMDLPDGSPLRNPIMTIKKSGEKASTIVQDLLTLARREISVKEVINLNRIVHDYLQSPEKAKAQSYHPETVITTGLFSSLHNVIGSPVHLSKSLMNLVHNAMEAMPEGGELHIATQNRTFAEPVNGYECIVPGNYVVLSVSDSGIGIAAEDLERIFEPFYTKKKMGKSGTGLGMAVVWGTVKDHGGYVNVVSQLGKGTTFSLYFPASVRPEEEKRAPTPIQSYSGNGESVLIVDDVIEQREIASGILTKLGYDVEVVESGEAAVAHLKENAVDILVLDMIMHPGIDGLETYKQIISFRRNQKAIIASGFTENERVREALSLGAGAFIRKPYSFEEIGMAVRTELNRTPHIAKPT